MNMMKTSAILMTQTGYDKARNELARKVKELQDICAERLLAHSLSGDGWHDNPYFNRLQQMEAEKTRDIASVQAMIQQTRLIAINPGQRPMRQVEIGAVVNFSILFHARDEELMQTWEIVGYNESDVERKQLAYNSPLAGALLGLAVGEEVEIALPGGAATVEILGFSSALN
jgi:transcription elongation factor GreA